MAAWRILAVLAGLSLSAGLASAQTYSLAEELKPGDCFHVRMDMSLTGELRVSRDGKLVPLRETASATHDFGERILSVDKIGLAEKSARRYATAKAAITVGNDRSEHSLNPERGPMVTQRGRDTIIIYCPATTLSHDELEMTEHLDTLTLTGLLPGKEVKIEETWKLSSIVVQTLCHFEGLTEHDLTGKLVAVRDNVATIAVAGTASGIELGALVKQSIDATCQFDLKAKRLTRVTWKQKDEREQGPASPASAVEVITTVQRAAIAMPDNLSDVALVSIPEGVKEPEAHLTHVHYTDPKARFEVVYGREWILVAQTEEHVVMRYLDRGDFVAQVTISPWEPAEKGKHMDPEKFRELMAKTPGWDMEKELQVGEVPADGGRWVYRISAQGQLDDAAVMQNFYLIAGGNGEQVVLVFTMTPKQAERFGSRDLSLAGSVDFPKKK
jgi:hypothetical protein